VGKINGKIILNLTLKKEWFDLIKKGIKKVEYREYKPYWIKRFVKNGYKNFDEIHFTNGYGRKMPFISVDFVGISVVCGDVCNQKNNEPIDVNKKYFVINLGEILETRNIL